MLIQFVFKQELTTYQYFVSKVNWNYLKLREDEGQKWDSYHSEDLQLEKLGYWLLGNETPVYVGPTHWRKAIWGFI